jgi:glycyl-tRNA synthetase beta chain
MVFEFPELQGTMGGIYAREQGMPEQIWKAIYFHYLPIGVEADASPSREQLGAAAVTWAAVSLSDKLDTVIGLLGAGEKVTGSRDPFGLRRQMHGIVRVLMDLPELTGLNRELDITRLAPDARADVLGFAAERVRYALEQRGFPIEIVRAATASQAVSPLRARRVAEALQAMRTSADFQALAVLFKRVKNIARERTDAAQPDPGALTEAAERALVDELTVRRPRIAQAIESADYKRALSDIAGFRPAVDRFFTEVFVMVDDHRVRNARLALMSELRDLILALADISEIVPQTE